MKLVYHSLGSLDRLAGYADSLERYLDDVSRDDTEIEVHGTARGGIADSYRYFSFQDTQDVTETMMRVRSRDVDGFAVGNVLDPGLREGREILSIPVTGLGETSLLMGCMTADRSSIVALSDKWIPQLRDRIRMYGLGDRVAAIHSMDVELDRMADAFHDDGAKETVLDGVERAVASCVEEGAEIAIPGGGIVSMLLNDEGIDGMCGVPIMDQVSVLVKVTETMVDLYRMGALETSEKRTYEPPADDFLAELASLYDLE